MKVDIGERIKALRERRNWTQTALAKKAGISKSVMSRIESGDRPVEDSMIVVFARVLETNADYLLGINSEDTPKKEWKPILEGLQMKALEEFKKLSPEDQEYLVNFMERMPKKIK